MLYEVITFNLLDRETAERIFLRTDLIAEVPVEEGFPLFLGLLASIRENMALLDFDADALRGLARFACRLCEHQGLLSLAETQLSALMRLADSLGP